jgi:hypothetical protein
MLTVMSAGHALHIFVNGQLTGKTKDSLSLSLSLSLYIYIYISF